MESIKSFIVVEDENTICEGYRTKVKEREKLYLIDTTDSSDEALRLVAEYAPDAVILDIELNKGSGSGISFLENLQNSDTQTKPLILVVTNITSSIMHNRIRELGGDFIITKNKPDYNIDSVLDMLESLISSTAVNNSRKAETAHAMAKAEYNKRRKDKIINELELIGVKPNVKGFRYLCDAIELYCDNKTDNLSRSIGEKYCVTADSVDKAMRHAIISAWNRDPDNFLTRYTAYISKDRGLPLLMEFISYYASKVRSEL